MAVLAGRAADFSPGQAAVVANPVLVVAAAVMPDRLLADVADEKAAAMPVLSRPNAAIAGEVAKTRASSLPGC